MLKNTGERLLPGEYNTVDEYVMILRHKFAYNHANKYLSKSDVVVEVGSGEGYGTSTLSETCKKITGVDVDVSAVDHANKQYKSKKCEFKLYNGGRLPFNDGSGDVVISFQVIEHVKDDALFVSEIYRVLKPGGVFIVATPNRLTRLKEGQKPFNKFHLFEYTPKELENVLKQSFEDVQVYGVSGTKEINRLEATRIAKIQKTIRLDPLGLRNLMPASIKLTLVKLLRRKTQEATDQSINLTKKFTISDFKAVHKNIDKSLDLLAVCKKAA